MNAPLDTCSSLTKHSVRCKYFSHLIFTFIAYSKMARRGPRPLVLCGPSGEFVSRTGSLKSILHLIRIIENLFIKIDFISGSGKSTLLKCLFAEFPETFGFRWDFVLQYYYLHVFFSFFIRKQFFCSIDWNSNFLWKKKSEKVIFPINLIF